ncbi:MAG: glutaredoxin domain-containing protein [Bacteroidales bacterium]|nr:glutaredoxin domain-containing protein [Bacteroidales bacterium]
MKIKEIQSLQELKSITEKEERSFLLLYRSDSEKSICALGVLEETDSDAAVKTVFVKADVSSVRDIHPEYGIETVPVLLEFASGALKNVYKGCNSRDFYISVLSGREVIKAEGGEKRQRNITVYSTPTCTWCNTLKTYLKERKVQFRDIDVSSDQKAAEQMVNKSGQQGVPQTDIDGHIIIGFDKKKIDSLLKNAN